MTSITARDIMNTEVLTVREDMTVQQLAGFLMEQAISGAPVVDSSGKLVGVVSLTDIVETASSEDLRPELLQGGSYQHAWEYRLERDDMNQLQIADDSIRVCEIMTPTVYTVPENTRVSDIAKTMIAGRIHRLLVTRSNAVVGIVTTLDLLQIVAELDGQAS